MKQCPKCNTENPKQAKFCRHCRYEFPEATISGGSLSPIVHLCKVREDKYWIGSIIHIDWQIDNANTVTINGFDVTSLDEYEIKVDKAMTVTIKAENDYDQISKDLRLSPRPLPSILSLVPSTYQVQAGNEIKLKWDVRYATRITLSSSKVTKDVSNKNYIKISLDRDEQLTLTAYAEDDNIYVDKTVDIRVLAPVVIHGFYADKDVVVESDKVTLRWNVENVDSIMIEPIMKDVTRLSSFQVSPARTTEYRLVASNMISRAEASLSVGVRTLPKIDINLGDTFAKMELPSCNVDLSFMSDNIKEAQIDRWLLFPSSDTIQSRIHSSAFKCIFLHFKSMIRRLISIPFRYLQKQHSTNM